jgi:asparagine synthase (glutamine-hydrolysing)
MCGIAGFIDSNYSRDAGLDLLENMLASIAHRGPDARGKWNEEHVFLGQNRLSIIDLSEASNQPFLYEDLVISFNGEIYNYIEIKEELIKKGHRFTTQGDTEVICAAYKEYGERCVEQFMGMWAFALWDKTKKKLFCSRDRFGIKPFYYIEKNGGFYFGSEYKVFKQIPAFDKTLNIEQIQRGIALNWVTYKDETYFKQLQSLEPSHSLVIENEQKKVYRYWDIDTQNKSNAHLSFKEKSEQFYHLFERSIKQHSRSDVPTGACLSGGLDSSSIVSLFATLFPNQPIKTFSIFYDGKNEVDERPFVREVVDKYKTVEPFYFSPNEQQIEDSFNKVAYHADVPLLGSTFISQHFLMKLAKEKGVTVAIDGQGADEYLGGYLHSFYRLLASQASSLQLGAFVSTFRHHLQREKYGFGKAVEILAKTGASLFFDESKIYNLEYKQKQAYFKSHQSIAFEKKSNNSLDDFLYQLLFNTTLQTLLHFEDRNSMTFSLESRVPFLDHRLVEFAFTLNDSDKINTKAETKFLLRESMKSVLPKAVYERKDKKGFVTPGEVKWLDGPLKHLLEVDYSNLEFLNVDQAKKEIEAFKQGDKSNAKMVWKLVCLNHWVQTNQ